jgi:hypothetical protein
MDADVCVLRDDGVESSLPPYKLPPKAAARAASRPSKCSALCDEWLTFVLEFPRKTCIMRAAPAAARCPGRCGVDCEDGTGEGPWEADGGARACASKDDSSNGRDAS